MFKIDQLASVALCFALLALAGCGDREVAEPEDIARPAKLIEIASSSNDRLVTLPAVIEATGSAVVTFQVGGALIELPVREGQQVRKGDVLARLDQRDFGNAVQQAQAQYTNAQAEYQRAETLIAENAIARSVYDQRRSARDVARAQLDSARKAMDDSVLRAPFDGVVAKLHIENFQNVSPQQNIATIQTTGAAEALVNIPATLVAFAGQITPLETSLFLDTAPNAPVPAELLSVSTQADPVTQTFAMRFGFTPPANLNVLPGMTGTVRSRLLIASPDGDTAQITVPVSAVQSDGEQPYVWVVDPETMSVSKREIVLAENRGVGVDMAIQSGLAAGDIIVGAGASYLFEGMKVRPYEQ